jgi:D-citramalate synthase
MRETKKWGIDLSDINFPRKIRIFDTTLRDGEQTPGVSLTPENKLIIARALDEFGVDVIEGGFARASKGEFQALKLLAKEGLKAEVSSMARANINDIELVVKCDLKSVTLVVPTSEIHCFHKLGKKRHEVLELMYKCVEYAKKHGLTVELLAEDGSRADVGFLKEFFSKGIAAGANRICLCDTVGVLTPEKSYQIMSELRREFAVPLSIHCHDDFGLAVSNSLAAVRAGADQVHVTVNGIGERAGNASLEEFVMSLICLYNVKLPVKTTKLQELSTLVSRMTGIPVPPNKAIVGSNAFSHESGLHTQAVIAEPATYEPISPEMVGANRRFTVGKHAGTHGVETMLKKMGLRPNKKQVNEILQKVKLMGDKGKTVTESDLQSIVDEVLGLPKYRPIKMKELTVITGNTITPTASIRLQVNGKIFTEADVGIGPVDAAVNAIRKLVATIADIKLEEYNVKAITGGTDAAVEVYVRMRKGDRIAGATGVHRDIVMASVEAVIAGMNVLMRDYSETPMK